MEKINYFDLKKKQHSMAVLEHNINNLEIKHILHTQTLDADFCAKYILDEYYCTCREDEYLIDFWYVLKHQPHITEQELDAALKRHEPFHKG
jgi:hypothetical protein